LLQNLQRHHSQLAASMTLAGPTDWHSFAMAFVWVELHLIAFDASIQKATDVSSLLPNTISPDQKPGSLNLFGTQKHFSHLS
jgi:hypothetical protein